MFKACTPYTIVSFVFYVSQAIAVSQHADVGCTLHTRGHPSIDLSSLTLTDQDFSVVSHMNDGYEYVINVCGDLNFQDETCHKGSSVCERHKRSDLATSVLAYSGSTSLKWVDTTGNYSKGDSYIEMTMAGGTCRANDNLTDAHTTVEFICSNKEFLMLQSEDIPMCRVSFVFYSTVACGTPRYSCFNGTTCLTSDNSNDYGKYPTLDACNSECAVPQPKYTCMKDNEFGYQCVEGINGDYSNFSACSMKCIGETEE